MTEEDLKEINAQLWKIWSFAEVMKVYIQYQDGNTFSSYYLADEIMKTSRKLLQKF